MLKYAEVGVAPLESATPLLADSLNQGRRHEILIEGSDS